MLKAVDVEVDDGGRGSGKSERVDGLRECAADEAGSGGVCLGTSAGAGGGIGARGPERDVARKAAGRRLAIVWTR